MAEASERPGEAWVPTLEAPQVYRPLSLLALLGLGLGVVFGGIVLIGGLMPFAGTYLRTFVLLLVLAPILGVLGAVLARQRGAERIAAIAALSLAGMVVLIGVGGLMAFSSTSPWMLDWWAWVLLLAAVLVNWLALSRIRAAEGTLAGRDLARAGLWIGGLAGAFYFLYMAGNLVAVTGQGQVATDRFLNLLKDGKVPQAFVETLKPGSRPDSGDLERDIEIVSNAPRGKDAGPYTAFRTSDLVQFIRHSGAKAKIVSKNAYSEFTKEGYRVAVTYEVSTELATFDAEVAAHSLQTGSGRVWYVLPGQHRLKGETLKPTARGQEFREVFQNSLGVVSAWLSGAGSQPGVSLFGHQTAGRAAAPGTGLPPVAPGLPPALGLAARGALGTSADRQAFDQGLKAFVEGQSIDDSQLYGDDAVRGGVKKDFVRWINRRLYTPVSAETVSVQIPDFRQDAEGVEVSWPARFTFIDPAMGGPRLTVDAEVVCRAPGPAARPDEYRVTSLRLMRAGSGMGAPAAGAGPKKAGG